MKTESKELFTSSDVILEEHERIKSRRKEAGYEKIGSPADDAVGLALSGGGIRSATFNLGILQALERCEVFRSIDYLSTVSGGGYIGSSLTWFMSRLNHADFPFDTADRSLNDFPERLLAQFRSRGSYLTPGDGLTWWALIAAVLNGIVVNFIVIIPVFLFILWMLGLDQPSLPFYAVAVASGLPFARYLEPTAFTVILFAGALLAVFSVATGVLFSLTTRVPCFRSYRLQKGTNKFMGRTLMYGVLCMAIGTIPIVTNLLELNMGNWVRTAMSSVSLAGIAAIWAGLFGKKEGNEARGLRSLLLSVGLGLLMYGIFLWLYHITLQACFAFSTYIIAVVCSLIVAFAADINQVSMHRFYRNRLMEAFLPIKLRNDDYQEESIGILDNSIDPPVPATQEDADLCLLHRMKQTRAPYHLINTTMQTVGSHLPTLRERGGDNFIFSPLFCGAASTKYVSTQQYIRGKVNLATAMAISGAAVDPNTYATRSRPLTFLMTMLNVRLGYWIRNPRGIRSVLWQNPSWYSIFSEMLGRGLDEDRAGIHLSDGGHFENLGLYELVRRECKCIIISDAGEDPDYLFSDLGKAIERVWVDFGAEITLDTRLIRPLDKKNKISRKACVAGGIRYRNGKKGRIIYIATTLIADLTEDIYVYQRKNPAFPDQGTGDQFFDEQQFEAYRELGRQIGMRYFGSMKLSDGCSDEDDPVMCGENRLPQA